MQNKDSRSDLPLIVGAWLLGALATLSTFFVIKPAGTPEEIAVKNVAKVAYWVFWCLCWFLVCKVRRSSLHAAISEGLPSFLVLVLVFYHFSTKTKVD